METLETQIIKAFLYLERYNPQAFITIENNLEVAQAKILSLIGKTQNQRLIRAELKKIMNDVFIGFSDEIINDIEQISEVSYNKFGAIMAGGFVTDQLSKKFKEFKNIDNAVREKLLNPNRLILGNNIDDLKNQMILGANNKLRAAILKGFDEKQGIDTINREVKTILGNLGKSQARTVVRTVVLSAIEEAKNEAFKFFEDEIDYWVYSSVLDTRTSVYCRVAHGYKTKDKEKAKYVPKSHYNCRSMWIIENAMTREADKMFPDTKMVQWNEKEVHHRDGTNSTKFSVGSVKKIKKSDDGFTAFDKLDEKYKAQYLGKKRYQLYKDGKATLREMVDISRNRLLPINEIIKHI